MAITISGENNNDKILAQDGVIDSISGFNIAGIITASSFTGDLTGDVTGNLTGNVTGNINNSTLLLQTGGTERLRIESGGDLRLNNADSIIHTSADTSRLRLFGGSTNSTTNGAALALHGVNHSSGNYAVLAAATGGFLKFSIGTAEKLRITSAGSVGINTATPIGDFTILTDGMGYFGIDGGGGKGAEINVYHKDTKANTFKLANNGGANELAQYALISGAGKHIWHIGGTTNERMRLTTTGLGIGTDNPKSKLNVYTYPNTDTGGILVQNANYAANVDKAYLIAGTQNWTGAATDWNTYGFQHKLKSDGSGIPRLSIDASAGGSNLLEIITFTNQGSVGIGSVSPAGVLDLYHATSNTILNVKSGDAGSVINLIDNATRSSIEQNGTSLKIVSDTAGTYANSDIRLQVDGSTKMLINSDGNVLIDTTVTTEASTDGNDLIIGSTSDTQKGISIVGSTTNGVGNIFFTDGASYKNQGIIQYRHADDSMRFTTAQYEALRIDSSGRVRINGGDYAYSANVGADDLIIGDDSKSEWMGLTIASNAGYGGMINFGDNEHKRGYIQYRHNGDRFEIGTAATERLRIDNNGRVILGGTNAGTYHQDGDEFNIYSTGNTGMSIFSGTSSLGSLFFADDNNDVHGQRRGAIQYNHNGNYLALWTNAGEKLRIDSSGNLLLSKGTQNTLMSYTSDGSDNQSVFVGGGGGPSDTRGAYIWAKGNEYTTTGGFLQLNAGNVGTAPITFSTGGSERLRIDSSGRLKINTTSANATNEQVTIKGGGDCIVSLRSDSHADGNDQKINFMVGDNTWQSGNTTSQLSSEIVQTSSGILKANLVISANRGDALTNRYIIYGDSNVDHEFKTKTAASLLKLYNSGNVGIIDGNLVLANGHGIDFSAYTPDGPSSSPNELLDDYEEGSYTPTMVGSGWTYTRQAGFYRKIGSIVHVSIWITASGGPNNGTTAKISLPFGSYSASNYRGGISGSWDGANFDNTYTEGRNRSHLNTNTSNMDASFPFIDNGGWTSAGLVNSGLYDGFNYQGSGSYISNS